MISYQEALDIIINNAKLLATECMSLDKSLGRICADSVTSSMMVPSFTNSAMDGFAVCAHATLLATSTNPVLLKINDIIAAGDNKEVSDADAVEIMTGARVPDQFDSVIPIEDVEVNRDTNSILITRPVKLHTNIRFPGEDFQSKDLIAASGTMINPQHIMAFAATGISTLEVRNSPVVTVISTGQEIVDNQGATLLDSQIYNSNSPYLLAELASIGVNCSYGGIVGDTNDSFIAVLKASAASDIIITTGAVSKGRWDFIPDSLKEFGAKILFHKINIRPGKPILFAILPNGTYFFGLPGNPASAAVGLRFLVMPLIRAILGLAPEKPMQAQLLKAFTKKGPFRHFLKANIQQNKQGMMQLDILDGQESFKISPLLQANVWAVASEEKNEYTQGEMMDVFPMSLTNWIGHE